MMRLLLFLACWLSAAVPPAEAVRVDAELVDSRDAPVRLSSFRGRALILFYEDRSSTEQNAALKRALRERAGTQRPSRAARVLGVANVASYDFWPARGFVLEAVRNVERRDNVQVLLDWKHALGGPPLRLPEGASSVVLLDATGRWVQAWSGPVEGPALAQFFEVLVRLVESSPDVPAPLTQSPFSPFVPP
jgi:hypothetical protein